VHSEYENQHFIEQIHYASLSPDQTTSGIQTLMTQFRNGLGID
jgi:hypothetical protein